MWGYFLYQGVIDPLGGINSLWPLFGIANQLLAVVALCVGTTVIIKMGKARYAWMTIAAARLARHRDDDGRRGRRSARADPKLGFLSHARLLEAQLAAGVMPAGARSAGDVARMIFNDRLDAGVALFFMAAVVVILVASIHEWMRVRQGTASPSSEVPFVARAQLQENL